MKEINQNNEMIAKTKGSEPDLKKLVAPALFCTLLWGSAPVMIKWGYEQLNIVSTGSILLFAGMRFFLAGWMVIAFSAIFSAPKRRKEKNQSEAKNSRKSCDSKKGKSWFLFPLSAWKEIALLASFQTIGQYYFYYEGLACTSGVMASIITGTGAFFALIVSAWVLHLEKMTSAKLIGCLIGFLGIFIMNWNGMAFTFSVKGEGAILASQICAATSSALIQLFSRKWNPVLLSGWQFVEGGLVLIIVALLQSGKIIWNLPGILILLWLAFVSAGAYSIWGVLLSKYPVSAVGIYNCTIPVFGVLFSWLFLHESEALNLQTLVALVLICSGIVFVNKKTASGKERINDEKTSKS